MSTTNIITGAAALYTDGGVILCNKSPYGGAWAFCAVGRLDDRPMILGQIPGGLNVADERIGSGSGLFVLPQDAGKLISNNVTEMWAAIRALESVPEGWNGVLYSDSNVTIGRLFRRESLNGLTDGIIARMKLALERVGEVKGVLLQGHPTKDDLKYGIGKKRGLPVSVHNKWCDEECGRLQDEWHAKNPTITYQMAKDLRDKLSGKQVD